MDVYGLTAPPELFRVDDLLDLSNDDIFYTSTTTSAINNNTASTTSNFHLDHHHLSFSNNAASTSAPNCFSTPNPTTYSADFANDLCVPHEDVAELEWLSNFVDDSVSGFPSNTVNIRTDTAFHGRSRTKRLKPPSNAAAWTSSSSTTSTVTENSIQNPNSNNVHEKKRESSITSRERSAAAPDVPRRCTHCASEKTPQWRTGPLGPKTLCNACGVRYKSGRLVPEYRPAASPTFVLTQHSNSHRKVLELRRQKEMLIRQQQEQQHHHDVYGHHYQVC